jgi:hypothetical protein
MPAATRHELLTTRAVDLPARIGPRAEPAA